MTLPTAADFPAFYHAVRGYDPFPWQTRLAEVVAADGWPAVLALPTAVGKKSAIEIAVFTLALAGGAPLAARRAPLRVFFVSDRRLAIDHALEHARALQANLLDPTAPPPVARVAAALRRFGGAEPLRVAAVPGGVYQGDRWADAPNQPTVCVTTVDQVGSRILFRGYGVDANARPVEAGLAGNDALFLLNEAHQSQPFLDTLRRIGHNRCGPGGHGFGPFRVVEISSTPATPPEAGARFALGGDDRAHPELARRLAAPKPAALLAPTRFEDEAVARAEAARGDGYAVVGVVVNRAASARAVFAGLPGKPHADKVLLTGRVRPWDRARAPAWLRGVRAGRDRAADTPLYVVATTTVEVGADLDFDYLVTEAAPLPALRQRFGRLDRLGRLGRARGVVLLRKQPGDDPVYGAALARTWEWLWQVAAGSGEVDFGVGALDALLGREGGGPRVDPVGAPVVFPAHLALWAQTSPEPVPSPDVAPYLHGAGALDAADIQVVWRADLAGDPAADDWVGVVAAAPPRSPEALPLPLGAALRWLAGAADTAVVADLEGVGQAGGGGELRPSVCWRGADGSFVTRSRDTVRPGDTLVVPARYGGLDEFGWNPPATAAVEDVGDAVVNASACAAPGRRRPVRVRLHPEWAGGTLRAALPNWGVRAAGGEDVTTEVLARLAGVPTDPLTSAVVAEAGAAGARLTPYPAGLVLSARLAPGFAPRAVPVDEESDDPGAGGGVADGPSVGPPAFRPSPVTLADHLAGVARRVDRFAAALGLDPNIRAALVRAAEAHDLGKADWRYQYFLYGGEPGDVLLAESGRDTDPGRERAVQVRAGLPEGFRHEFVSVALLRTRRDAVLGDLPPADAELAEYLVGSHHGRGRPFPPVVPEAGQEVVGVDWGKVRLSAGAAHGLWRLDSGWAELFWAQVGRFGPWGLAFLEAVLRLADGARSAGEQEIGGGE